MLQNARVASLRRSDLKDLRAPIGQPMLQFVAKRCFKSQFRSGSCAVEEPAGGTDKVERRREPGAAVQAQPLPGQQGEEWKLVERLSSSRNRSACRTVLTLSCDG